MTPERWKTIEEIYHSAMAHEPQHRSAFLDEACGDDQGLRQYLESMVAASADGSNFMTRPALQMEAVSMAESTASGSSVFPDLGARYAVLEEIGHGGMGIVYKVRDLETDETVAAKVLHPHIAADQHMIERFKMELKLSRQVTHRNVCRIYDIHRSNGVTFITMELVHGESLRRILDRLGALSVRKGVELTRQVCEGMQQAHAKSIIHRDLKPENIMLDLEGNVKLMDFGIARLTSGRRMETIGVPGTPSYMSPEQAGGHSMDRRSDIYSLGLVMYEIFTGRTAFKGDTPVAVALKQIHESPPGPRTVEPLLTEDVEKVILRCLEKDPALRFQSLAEVADALGSSVTTLGLAFAPIEKPRVSAWFRETSYILPQNKARYLLMLIQAGYMLMYVTTLYHLDSAVQTLGDFGLQADFAYRLLILSSTIGIATRLYLMSALVFNHPETGRQFSRLFPALLLLDALWAASPLLVQKMGLGPALICTAVLAYLPFSQKTLIVNAYR